MMVLVSYDVSTRDDAGRRRLRRVARLCEDHGQRVQNSVFECVVDSAQWVVLRASLVSEALVALNRRDVSRASSRDDSRCAAHGQSSRLVTGFRYGHRQVGRRVVVVLHA